MVKAEGYIETKRVIDDVMVWYFCFCETNIQVAEYSTDAHIINVKLTKVPLDSLSETACL